MLHDLYLLACYFEGPQAILYEEDLKRRYGVPAIREAVSRGLVEVYCEPCQQTPDAFFCRLSERGAQHVEGTMM